MNAFPRRDWSTAVAVMVVVAALAGALTAPTPAHARSPGKDAAPSGAGEGIVQSVSASAIVLRELDGSTVSVPVASSTHVFVDGKRASLRDVKVGFVASGTWKVGKPATLLQAFDSSGKHAVSVGVVDSVTTGVLVVTGIGGTKVSIPVDAKTRVFLDGKAATLAAVKPGYTVAITAKDSKGGKPAHELHFLRPG
jgi:hypothetical protein